MIETEKLSPDSIIALKVEYELGKKHLQDFKDNMKHFRFPERRIKCFDTIQYEKRIPIIEEALIKLGIL